MTSFAFGSRRKESSNSGYDDCFVKDVKRPSSTYRAGGHELLDNLDVHPGLLVFILSGPVVFVGVVVDTHLILALLVPVGLLPPPSPPPQR